MCNSNSHSEHTPAVNTEPWKPWLLTCVDASCLGSRLQNLLQVVTTGPVCGLVVFQLLFQICDLGRRFRAFTSKAFVDGIDGDVDEPRNELLVSDKY